MGRQTSANNTKGSKKSRRFGASADDQSSMDNKTWTTAEQRQFLWDRFDAYMSHVPDKKYQAFWTTLEKEWKDRWPEIKTTRFVETFGGRQENELDASQLDELAKAEEKRLLQLQTWYRWRAPPMHQRDLDKQHTKLDAAINALACRQRALRPYEMYSNMFRERFEEELQTQYSAHPEADPGERLKIWREVAQKCYANEEAEIKSAVISELEESAQRRKKGKEAKNTPQSYLQAINDLNPVIGRYFDVLSAKTGWLFMVLMGGPHPKNQGGAIEVMSHSVGASYNDKFFPDAMIGFEDVVMQPWINHLKLVYPPAVCAERALGTGGLLTSEPIKLDGLMRLDSSPSHVSTTNGEVEADEDNDDSDRGRMGGYGDGDNREGDDGGREEAVELTELTTAISTEGSITTSAATTPVSFSELLSAPMSIDQSTTTTNFTDLLAASPQADDFGHSASLLGQPMPPATPMAGVAASALNLNATDFPFVFGPDPLDFNQNGSALETFDFTMFSNPMFNNVSVPMFNGNIAATNGEHFVNLGSWSQPGLAAPAEPLLPSVGPSPPSTSDASSSGLASAGTPTSTEAGNPISTSSNTMVTSPIAPSSTQFSTPLPTSDTNLMSPTNSSSPAAPAAAGPLASRIPFTSSNAATVTQVITSRGRQVKPSQSAEQMNRIGSTAGSILHGKENIPPSSSESERTEPEWLMQAKGYLTRQEFGEDWAGCISAWLVLEQSPKAKNGTMPLPKERPKEWTQWVLKTGHGRRGDYDQVPTINGALEFGVAVMKWWHDIQPEFRQTKDSLHPALTITPPAESSRSVWNTLKKNGPNGLVIMLVLLSWWGNAAKQQSRWEDDSTSAWQKTVTDVRRVLGALANDTNMTGKRVGDCLPEAKKKRRTA